MQIQAFAKVNWALSVRGKRADGYHELDTLMQSIELHDLITIEDSNSFVFSCNDQNLLEENNLLLRAINAYFSPEENFSFHHKINLHKSIPSCAGLGGASADAAAMLFALNELCSCYSKSSLFKLAATLGADVPFCLSGALARCTGIGEKMLPLPAKSYPLLLLKPREGISTKALFESLDSLEDLPPIDIIQMQQALLSGDFSAVRGHCFNHLQLAAQKQLPIIGEIINSLYEQGARFAGMSGSGSCCFAVFHDEREIENILPAFKDFPFAHITHTRIESNYGL